MLQVGVALKFLLVTHTLTHTGMQHEILISLSYKCIVMQKIVLIRQGTARKECEKKIIIRIFGLVKTKIVIALMNQVLRTSLLQLLICF